MSGSNENKVELTLPFKAEYVSIARLTASGVSNRMGFDIETIEDIKVALAEVCNKLVAYGSSVCDSYKIIFNISEKELNIVFDSKDKTLDSLFREEHDELGISIIQALMDSLSLSDDSSYILSMSKSIEGSDNDYRE